MLSTSLPGCSREAVEPTPPAPAAIAVDTRTAPPAELLRCPERPEGFPGGETAVIPESVRAALMRLAAAFARNADRHRRLIEWERGEPCIGSTGQ